MSNKTIRCGVNQALHSYHRWPSCWNVYWTIEALCKATRIVIKECLARWIYWISTRTKSIARKCIYGRKSDLVWIYFPHLSLTSHLTVADTFTSCTICICKRKIIPKPVSHWNCMRTCSAGIVRRLHMLRTTQLDSRNGNEKRNFTKRWVFRLKRAVFSACDTTKLFISRF